MADIRHTPWKVDRDIFASVHVYDAGGDRLTNERMTGTEGWDDTAHVIAASPKLLEALLDLTKQYLVTPGDARFNEGILDLTLADEAIREALNGEEPGFVRAALAKAKGKDNG